MPQPEKYTDEQLLALLQSNKEEAIDHLFRRYYSFVCNGAYRIIRNAGVAEDLAQEVFYNLWNKRNHLKITTSLKSYLSKSIRNRTLNYIRDQRMKFDDPEVVPDFQSYFENVQLKMEADELQKIINKAVNQLPERCRIVFSLSRYENMTYQEIATELNISIKTVENQISKALKYLRVALKSYL